MPRIAYGGPLPSAEVIARAIIAAARAYGDDPLRFAEDGHRFGKRCLPAAASGLNRADRGTVPELTRLFGLGKSAVHRQRAVASKTFTRAEEAARASAMQMVFVAPPPPPPPKPPPPPPPPAPLPRPPANAVRAERNPLPPSRPVTRLDVPSATQFAPTGHTGPTLPARILNVLADGACTPVALASILGAKEDVVGQTLRVLEHERRVSPDALTDKGIRGRLWRRS